MACRNQSLPPVVFVRRKPPKVHQKISKTEQFSGDTFINLDPICIKLTQFHASQHISMNYLDIVPTRGGGTKCSVRKFVCAYVRVRECVDVHE